MRLAYCFLSRVSARTSSETLGYAGRFAFMVNSDGRNHTPSSAEKSRLTRIQLGRMAITVPLPGIATPSVIDHAVADCKTHRCLLVLSMVDSLLFHLKVLSVV